MPIKTNPVPDRVPDLSGKVFGVYEVLGYSHIEYSKAGKNNFHYWVVRCNECGSTKIMLKSQFTGKAKMNECECCDIDELEDPTVGRGLNYLREHDIDAFLQYIQKRELQRSSHYRTI